MKRVTVWLCLLQGVNRQKLARARLIVDDYRGFEQFRQLLSVHARDCVSCTAGSKTHEHFDGAGWILLRVGRDRERDGNSERADCVEELIE